MYFDMAGSGPAVVLLHGAPNSPTHLLPLARELSGRSATFVAHLPGYGNTPPPESPYSLDVVNRGIASGLRARGVTRAALIGFSGGAYRALALALSGELEVTGIMTLAGFAGFTDAERAGYHDMSRRVLAEGPSILGPLIDALMLSPECARGNPAALAEVRSWAHAVSAETLAAELEAFASAPDLTSRVHELPFPIVARAGSRDAALPATKSDELARAARHGNSQIVEGPGHAILLEDFAGTLEAARAFLATTDTPRDDM